MPRDGNEPSSHTAEGEQEGSRGYALQRRDLLKVTGAGALFSTIGLIRKATTGATSGGEMIWKFDTGGGVFSSPTVVGDSLFVGGSDNSVYALDIEDGELLWEFEPNTDEISSSNLSKWKYDSRFAQVTPNSFNASPTVVDGVVFIRDEEENVYALNAVDGDPLWVFNPTALSSPKETIGTKFNRLDYTAYTQNTNGVLDTSNLQERFSISSSPTVKDERVFIGGINNNVYALNAEDGNPLWVSETAVDVTSDSIAAEMLSENRLVQVNSPVTSSPTVADGMVLIKDGEGNVHAMDVEDGDSIWVFNSQYNLSLSPRTITAKNSFRKQDNNVNTLKRYSGSPPVDLQSRWSPIRSSPTMKNGRVYVGSDNSLYALNAEDGSPVWTFETGDLVMSSPTVRSRVFVGSVDGNVYALDPEDGNPTWDFETGANVSSSPTVVAGVVFVGGGGRSVYALDAEDGNLLWEFQTQSDVISSPTIVDGVAFVGSGDGHIYALDAGIEGSSAGSRVNLGTLGHHHVWADQGVDVEASFTYDPEEPAVEETVRFDASNSKPTADIEEYHWDLTDDEEADETGEVVEWAFETAGNHPVSLTVATDHGEDTSTEVIPVDVPTGRLEGTIVDDEDALPPAVDVYVIDALHRSDALDYVGGSRDELPSYLADATTDEDGTFEFTSIKAGSYVVLVDPDDPFAPILEDDVRVLENEITDVELVFDPDRPLGLLEDVMESTHSHATAQTETVTEDVAEVYLDGYELFEDPELDGADYLDKALSLANFAVGLQDPDAGFTAAEQLRAFAGEQLGMAIAEYGYHRALADRWESFNGTVYQDQLDGYTANLLDADDIINFEPTGSLDEATDAFFGTTMYNESTQALDEALATFEEDLVFREPPDGLAMSEVKDVLETQGAWFRGDGLAPGMILTPHDNTYVIGETEYHKTTFDSVKMRFEVAEGLDLAAQGVTLAGKGLQLTGVGAGAGAVAAVGGWAASMLISMYQLHAKNRLADTWVNSLTYWVSDLDDIWIAYTNSVTWLETELADPTDFAALDGTTDTDLGDSSAFGSTYLIANEPEYPWWWVLPDPLYRYVGPNKVEVTNTGSEPTEARVLVSMHSGADDADNVEPGNAVSVKPRFDEEPLTLSPGESATVEVEFSADFELADALSWHVMSTALWMDGKFVDEVEDTFYVVPSVDWFPELSAETIDRDSITGDEAKAAFSTASDGDALYGDTVEVIADESLDPAAPEQTASYEVPGSIDTVVFLLSTVPGADIHLHVRDEQGRHVGFDPAVDADQIEIPDATYNGSESALEVITVPASEGETLTVRAIARSFTSGRPVSVTVHAIEIPDRDAVMAVAPTTIETTLSPGETKRFEVDVGEIGKQAPLENVDIRAPTITNSDGDELVDATVDISPGQFDVAPDENQSVTVTLETAETIALPDTPESRYEGTATIGAENAGNIEADLSVLVLDTDVGDARLTAASADVTGVSLHAVDSNQVPDEKKPTDLTILAAYEIQSVGDGEISIGLGDNWETTDLSVLTLETGIEENPEEWDEPEWERWTEELVFTTGSGWEGYIVIGETGLPVADYTNEKGIVDTPGLREAIDDWRAGDISTDLLRDVIDAWRSGEEVV